MNQIENIELIECDKMAEKICGHCKLSKPVNAFTEKHCVCKVCRNALGKIKSKVCIGCNTEKGLKEFRRGQPICTICEANPDIIYNKRCEECGETKPSNTFRTNRKKCHECEKTMGRNYRRTTNTAAIWVENNREKMSELQHNNYEKNKKAIREKESEKYHSDEFARDLKKYRCSIAHFIKNGKTFSKKLNINKDQYVAWLEYRFTNNMTLDNYAAEWQIDHIIPLDGLKTKTWNNITFEEDTECIYAWYNTMPVSCSYNLKKNKYISRDQLVHHITKVQEFLRNNKKLKIAVDDHFIIYKKIVQKILDSK